MANAPTPFPVLDSVGADAVVVENATLGTPPAPQTQQRKARAARAREARAHLSASWARAEEDAEAAVSWSHRMLQDRGARAAMTASLDLWMWPSDGQDSEGHPAGGHGLHETMFDPVARGGLHATGSAGGDGHAEIAIFGGSSARSDGPSDEAIHTMTEADGPSSPPVRVEPAVGGGVGVGAWGPQDGGHGMALDSCRAPLPHEAGDDGTDVEGAVHGRREAFGGAVGTGDGTAPVSSDDDPEGGSDTGRQLLGPASQHDGAEDDDSRHPALGDGVGGGEWGPQDSGNGMALDSETDLAVAGAGARCGVGGLGSGQVGPDEVVDGLGLSAAGGASARPSTACGEAMDVVGGIDMQLALADIVAPAADSPSPAIGGPPTSFTYKQRRVWLRNQRRKGTS